MAEAELPQRFRRAEEVYQRKFWREQLCDWNETFKPKAIKAHRERKAFGSAQHAVPD